MDFKERFKGRTTTVSKQGVIDNLATSINPVQKAQYTSAFPQDNIANLPMNDFSQVSSNNGRLAYYQQTPSSNLISNANIQSGYSATPSHSHYSQQQQTNYHSKAPSGLTSHSEAHNPYLVNNPMPTLHTTDHTANFGGYGNTPHGFETQENSTTRHQQYKSMSPTKHPNNFNPNSFYNQHSQFRGLSHNITPRRENTENIPNYTGNQEIRKPQNKQKRAAEEVLKGYGNQSISQGGINSPYKNQGHNQVQESYEMSRNNFRRPTPPQMGYEAHPTRYRDIHSNPAPHHHLEANAFGPIVSHTTNNFDRGSQMKNMNPMVPMTNPEAIRNVSLNRNGFKPYNLKDYKDVKASANAKLGGLGPNTNTQDWMKEKEKRDKMAEFSQNVKFYNAQKMPLTDLGFNKPKKDKEKELSRREVALQFAKNIQRPKLRRPSPALDHDDYDDDNALSLISKPSESDKNVAYGGTGGDLDEFEEKHRLFQEQLQRVKLGH